MLWADARAIGNNSNETYLVIKVTDENKTENKGDNKVEYKAITASQFKTEEKRVNDDYKQKMKEWHDLKKTDPQAPMPMRTHQEVPKTYETQKIAQEYADKLKDEEANNGDAQSKDKK